MQLGKALIGALIGAAVATGLLVVVYLAFGIDKVWLSIPFAILTGLGVRMLVSTSGHASYARGALTVVLALAAYVAGWWVVAQVAIARAGNAPPREAPPVAEAPAEPAEGGTEEPKTDEVAEAPPAEKAPAAARRVARRDEPRHRPNMPREFSTWDAIWLATAALIAYELGRGTGVAVTPQPSGSGPVPGGTHPDA